MNKPAWLYTIITILFLSPGCIHDSLIPIPAVASNFPIVVELPDILRENSGIILSDEQHLWTHNDSGDAPRLYEISLKEKNVTKTVQLRNASHIDWEAITSDASFVYLGDTGNNNGTRKDLAIYKILKSDLQSKDSVEVSTISYSYSNQNDFSPSTTHNFDCEAIISIGNLLYLFTKNRGNQQSNIYTLPNIPGTYSAEWQDSLLVEGLLTAAAINDAQNVVCLLGYNMMGSDFEPFLWIFYDYQGTDFLTGKRKKVLFDLSLQTEALCFKNDYEIYFTSEEEVEGKAYVYVFDVSKWF